MADISKFGVPLDGEKLGILQPKLKHRYRLVFDNFGQENNLREMTQNVQTVDRPSFTQPEVEVHSYVSRAYFGGKPEWDNIEITVRDDITNAVSSAIGSQVQRQFNHFEQTSAIAGSNYKFGLEIHTLGGGLQEELESWQLYGCWITNVDWPDGDYTNTDDFQLITMTVRFDNAVHLAGPFDNDGNTVGGDPFPNITSPIGGVSI